MVKNNFKHLHPENTIIQNSYLEKDYIIGLINFLMKSDTKRRRFFI